MCTAMDSDEVFVSFSDTVFGFWEDLQEPPEYSTNSSKLLGDDDEQLFSVENDYKAFWEKQYLLLQVQFHSQQRQLLNGFYFSFPILIHQN